MSGQGLAVNLKIYMTTSRKHRALLTFTDALSFILATNISPDVPRTNELCVISIFFFCHDNQCVNRKKGVANLGHDSS